MLLEAFRHDVQKLLVESANTLNKLKSNLADESDYPLAIPSNLRMTIGMSEMPFLSEFQNILFVKGKTEFGHFHPTTEIIEN